MKDIKATRGTALLRKWVAEGEHEHQDFKFAISDARKIARSISAFANHEGGRLLIGVKDNGTIAGVRNDEDIYVVEQAAERYCRPSQNVEFHAYRTEGVHVIVAEISASGVKPVKAAEPDGTWRAYYRVADENIAAHPLMEAAWVRSAEGGGRSLAVGPQHSVLLQLAAERPFDDARDAALALHISIARAEELIVELASMGLLEFFHNGKTFLIRAVV